MLKSNSRLSAAVCAATLALACARSPQLEPAVGSSRPPGMPAAVLASEQGVRVIAEARGWPGPADIADRVTPLHISLENGSAQPLQIRYSSFELVAARDRSYRAIPPRRVRGIVFTDDYIQPAFTYRRFYAAPYYRGYYAGVPAYSGEFLLDAPYHGSYDGYWQSVASLPTPEMIARALPEGVLSPGGKLDGYVYFERLEQKRGASVDLRVALNAAGSDAGPFVSVRLPFVLGRR